MGGDHSVYNLPPIIYPPYKNIFSIFILSTMPPRRLPRRPVRSVRKYSTRKVGHKYKYKTGYVKQNAEKSTKPSISRTIALLPQRKKFACTLLNEGWIASGVQQSAFDFTLNNINFPFALPTSFTTPYSTNWQLLPNPVTLLSLNRPIDINTLLNTNTYTSYVIHYAEVTIETTPGTNQDAFFCTLSAWNPEAIISSNGTLLAQPAANQSMMLQAQPFSVSKLMVAGVRNVMTLKVPMHKIFGLTKSQEKMCQILQSNNISLTSYDISNRSYNLGASVTQFDGVIGQCYIRLADGTPSNANIGFQIQIKYYGELFNLAQEAGSF